MVDGLLKLLHLIEVRDSFDLGHLIVIAVRYQLRVLLHIFLLIYDRQLTPIAVALLADDFSRYMSTLLVQKSVYRFLIPTHYVPCRITLVFLVEYRVNLVFDRGKVKSLTSDPLMLYNSP